MTDDWNRVISLTILVNVASSILEQGSSHHSQHSFLLFIDLSKSTDLYLIQTDVIGHSFFHLCCALAHSQSVLAESFRTSEDDKLDVFRFSGIFTTDFSEDVG